MRAHENLFINPQVITVIKPALSNEFADRMAILNSTKNLKIIRFL